MIFGFMKPGKLAIFRSRPIIALLTGLVLSGCTGMGEGPQTTIRPESDSADIIQGLYALVTWIDIGIFVVVAGLLIATLFLFRESRRGPELPKQIHGNLKLEILWTLIPVVLLLFIAFPTWSAIFRAANPPEGKETYVIEAIGHQWWWEFKYPEEGITTANEMHVPLDRPVVIRTTSVDVIHSIWIPKLAGKIDSLPGKINQIWFTPRNAGKYFGQCAEFCGTSHANMRFLVYVEPRADFDGWVARQRRAPKAESADALAGQKLFAAKACVACHTISGVQGAVGTIGPNLNDLGSRSTLASAIIDNTPENLARWIQNPQKVKPGALMKLPLPVSDEEAKQLAAYLTSNPSGAAAPAASAAAPAAGGAAAMSGKTLFATKGCGACHKVTGVPGAVGAVGPALDGFMGREKIAAGTLANNPENLKKWLKNPPAVKPGTLMPNLGLSDPEVDALSEFLKGLK